MKSKKFAPSAIAVAVSLLFAPPVLANPTGAQVVNGAVSISQPNASTLNITNSPGAIINWQGFSIGAGEVTRFIQNSASSAVLNRVVGPDISAIQGQLLSNGRVFLINPAGIIVGPNAMIDTAGFVGSSLNLGNADFLAGKLRFSGDATSGTVINQGWIRTSFGGNVLLVAPSIQNSGLIQTPGGELILAAGQKLTVSSMEQGGVQFEVQAPTDSVLNVGKLLADGGAVGVFAGTLRHSGEIRANALVRDAAGEVVLKAANDIQIASGSVTSASGKAGGSITIASGNGLARVAGTVAATGSEGKGGGVTITGERVTAADGALINVSGAAGGGQILLGGDYQGANAAVRNATTTFVGNATLRADATNQGDGGRIIVWGDDSTRFYGSLSAQGGAQGGNGGFAEVSGKNNLLFEGTANLSAPKGLLGSLLLDPLDLYVATGGGIDGAAAGSTKTSTLIDEATDFPSSAVTVAPATLAGIAGNVTLFASRYMRISNDVTLTTAGQALTATVSKYVAPALPDPNALDVNNTPNRLDIAANVTTNNGAISLSAPLIQTVAASKFTTAGGAIALTSGTNLSTNALTLDAGAGAVTLVVGTDPSNFMQLSSVTGGTVTANAPSLISLGNVTTGAGALTLTSTGSSVTTSNIVSTGGAITINAPQSSINTGSITGGGAAVTLASLTSVNTGAIDTTGAVSLTAPGGFVSATVNNAASLTATAGTSVTINSATDVNVAAITAGINSAASVSTSKGTIRATSDAAKVSGLDVTLSTGQLTGGGIVGATQPLSVDVQRTFTFSPNGTFNVVLTGAGPNRLTSNIGVAPTGLSYNGTLTRSSGGLTLSASATDTAVTLTNLSVTSGFDQRVSFTDPAITVNVPNGALVANSVAVPAGDGVSTLGFPNGFALPVTLQSQGNLTLNSYTRSGGGLPKTTSITSSNGVVTLGGVDASKDTVTVNGLGGVQALVNGPGQEITTAGTLTITSSSGNIGASGVANPLDITAPTITLNATESGSSIGGSSGAVIANTPNLTVNSGGTFNVSSGATALKNLTVTANAAGVGAGGPALVRTEAGGANDKTYNFSSNGTDFTLAIGKAPLTQFAGGTLKFTSSSGAINLAGNTDLGTGKLDLSTNFSDINTAGSSITASDISLKGNQNINTVGGAITATGATGGITLTSSKTVNTGNLNAPGTVSIGPPPSSSNPAVSVGAIGNVTAPETVTVNGSTVTTGAVTGVGGITLNANSGLLTLGGAVSTADGKSITLTSRDPTKALNFTAVGAGATGTITITSPVGIQQTAAGGITAKTVTLSATNSKAPINQAGGDGMLDLMGTQVLTLTSGGPVSLDANGSVLSALTITKTATAADAPFSLANLGGQAVSIANGATPFDFSVTSAASPLSFKLDYSAGQAKLVGGGINSGGGNVILTMRNGTNSSLDANAGITTGGGSVTVNLLTKGALDASSGNITTGGGSVTVNLTNGALDASSGNIMTGGATGGGAVSLTATDLISTKTINTTPTGTGTGGAITIKGGGVVLNGDLRTGAGGGAIALTSSAPITSAAGVQIVSDKSVALNSSAATGTDGTIGSKVTPLEITSPTVTLTATRNPTAGTGGDVFATLRGTTNLTLSGDNGFSVSSDTAFSTLSLATKGTGSGAFALSAAGQTYTFDRPATDLFGANVAGTAFELVSVTAPAANTTFTAADGVLLIRGAPGSPNRLNVNNLTLNSANGGDINLQGNAANPLLLSHPNQTFAASGGATADILIRGTVALNAGASQSLSASGNISVSADALGGGLVTMTAPTQTLTTTGGASKMEFLGGAAAGEKVVITAGNSQIISAFSTSVDSVKFKGGAGADASVTLSHSGPGTQQFQVQSGTVTVEGGGGRDAFAKVEETGTNTQQLCRDVPVFGSCGGGIGALSILGGLGPGAYAQISAAAAQLARVNALNIKGGPGDGAYALMQAGTTQQFLSAGTTTLLGGGGSKSTAQLLSTGNQNIDQFSGISLGGGSGAGSLAAIATSGIQTIRNGGAIQLTAGGAAATPAAGTHALIEGKSQQVNAGALIITGGTGDVEFGGASDALLRNLDGAQTLSTGAITIIAGAATSTAGILNKGTGAQTITSSGAITLQSLAGVTGAVLIGNTPMTEQKLTANGGTFTLSNQGGGLISATSAGTQTVTARAIDVHTAPSSTGNSLLTATGNQWLRTTNGTTSGVGSMRVAALGTGLANIESGASQLIELDYPQMMQGLTLDGALTVGNTAAAGKSRIGAVDQTIFAKSVLIQTGGPAAGTQSEIKSTNKQVISILGGNLQVLGGSGANSLAQIDPIDQNILVNGSVLVQGGSGANAVAQITSSGTQTLFTTNGNIDVIGGTGPGSNASITSVGLQNMSASGGITATSTPGGGSATIGGAAPPVTSSGASSVSGTPSSTVIALGDTQTGVVTEAEPEDNPNNNDPLRRAPICY